MSILILKYLMQQMNFVLELRCSCHHLFVCFLVVDHHLLIHLEHKISPLQKREMCKICTVFVVTEISTNKEDNTNHYPYKHCHYISNRCEIKLLWNWFRHFSGCCYFIRFYFCRCWYWCRNSWLLGCFTPFKINFINCLTVDNK